MGLLTDLIELFRGFGLPEEEARAAADAAWAEIQRMRSAGSPTRETDKAIAGAELEYPTGGGGEAGGE